MPASAIGLALLSGLWPVGLAVMVAYLNRPLLRYAVAYLLGAATAEGVSTVVVLAGLSALGATPSNRSRSGWAAIVIGLLMMLFAFWIWTRPPRPPKVKDVPAEDEERGRKVLVAYGLGLVMWLPSPTYLAALKQISDVEASAGETALYGVIAVLCVLWILELPLAARLLLPRPTKRHLGEVDEWVRAHAQVVLAALTLVCGVILTVSGIARVT
jgi:cytochrome c biogenesis protein CcdA